VGLGVRDEEDYVHLDPRRHPDRHPPDLMTLDGLQDEQAFRFNERDGGDVDRFAKTLGSVAGRRVPYDDLTGKVTSG
jgi:hypothetical protein